MDIFGVLKFAGGLALFLFGMSYMGSALEKKAGGKLSSWLSTMSSNKFRGFFLGLGVTAIIQSSSATTVMVVGFVNSGIMKLSQSVGVIMGANVGTTITAWILSLTGINGANVFLKMLKPSSFTPIIAVIGVILYAFVKDGKKKDIGMILVGFSVLMFGMDTISTSVSGLRDIPEFQNLFLKFENPILGVLTGVVLTAIIQSSSASVGILQALSVTGQVSLGAAIPIILGQNIGTCITAMIASVGANKNAKRAAVIHLNFNIIGSSIILIVFYTLNAFIKFKFLSLAANQVTIAAVHTLASITMTAILMPFSKQLEKLACRIYKDNDKQENEIILDERLFINPSVAVEQASDVSVRMAHMSVESFNKALSLIEYFDHKKLEEIREEENTIDRYEDVIGSYLVKLSAFDLSIDNSRELSKLLHVIADFERISDHAVHIAISAQNLNEKELSFSDEAKKELAVLINAVKETLDLTLVAFGHDNIDTAVQVEPLEQVVDRLTSKIKNKHIERLRNNICSVDVGIIMSDIVSVLERVSDHCSDIAASIIEISHDDMDVHGYLNEFKKTDNPQFMNKYEEFKAKYSI